MRSYCEPSCTDVWDRYAPFFNAEEGTVFAHDIREMEFYRRVRQRIPGPCLEIGAGSGRLSRSLSDPWPTAALEPSTAMLDSWTTHDRKLAHRVRGVGQSLPFRSGCFRFACFPYNGLQCVLERDGRRGVIHEAHRVLEPGGMFLFEVSPAFSRRPSEPRTRRYRAQLPDGGFLELDEEVLRPPGRGSVVYDMIYTREDPTGSRQSRRVALELAGFNVMEAVDDSLMAGFRVDTLWGDYDESPFDDEGSPRLIVPAVKE